MCLLSGFTSSIPTITHDQRHDLTVAGASAEWLVVGFVPLLRGADGSPHSTPVGFPPGRTMRYNGFNK